jgi:hypothetical protein
MKITKGKQARAQRVVLYGVESVGKSTFAAQFPNPLFLDIEQGTSHLDVDRCDINSWKQLTDSLAEAKATDYQTIVIDSADWAERLCVEDLLATSKKTSIEDFGFGKGWVMVAERMSRMLASVDTLIDAGKNVVLIAHSKIVRFEAPDALAAYDRYELKLSKQSSPLLKEFADELWFLRFKTKVSTTDTGRGKGIGGKERILLTTHSAAYDAKTRSGLAEELPLEWASVSHLFPIAKAAPAPRLSVLEDQKARDVTVVKTEDWTIEVAKNGAAATAFLQAKEQITADQDWTEASDRVLERIRQDVPKFLATVAAFHDLTAEAK